MRAWPRPAAQTGLAAGVGGKVVQKSRAKVVNLIFESRVLLTRPGESGAPGLMKSSRRATGPAG
jgi:hypothetical protein